MPLKVTVQDKGDGTFFVRPEGSIDANTFMTLQNEIDAILAKSPKVIIFNMMDVKYVSSAGVGVVLLAEQELQPKNGKVLMVNLQPQIKKVFDIVKALPEQQIFSSLEEMDRYLDEVQRKVRDGEM
ncbi:STAS domain-containing protein [bacterium]|nr:STAS domain-containing protein [bacterium]MCI0618286.1 STAS domain-containing protein [bacterium]